MYNHGNSYVHRTNSELFHRKSSLLVAFSLLTFSFIGLLLSFGSYIIIPIDNVKAAMDIDTSGNGRATAYDGEEGIATNGDSFCTITNDIAGGKFSSLFEGIVDDCDNDSQSLNQFLVEYSYTKNPVKIEEKTYLTMTVKDKETGNPISNAFVKLAIGPASQSQFDSGAFSTALATAAAAVAGGDVPMISSSIEGEKKTIQTMYTDNEGHATFTVQLGPNSDTGMYDTEIEVSKDSYLSGFEQIDLRVI
jgi:hypothetical protein